MAVFVVEDAQGLQGCGDFVGSGKVFSGLVDVFGGGAFVVEYFGGAGNHDLQNVDVFAQHRELAAQGMEGFVSIIPEGVVGVVGDLNIPIHFPQVLEFFLFVDASGHSCFGKTLHVGSCEGACVPVGAVCAAFLEAACVESVYACVCVSFFGADAECAAVESASSVFA